MKVKLPPKTGVISCKVFEPELSALGIEESKIVYLEQNFHRDPKFLLEKVKESLAALEQNENIESVVVLYGYCGGGLENLSSRRLKLIVPLAHDCIPLLLGLCPGNACSGSGDAFFLSPGWIDHGLTPYTEYFASVEKYGKEDALWMATEILKGYNEVVLVENTAGLLSHHREYAREMAELFGLSVREIKADKSWLFDLLSGTDSEFVRVITPGNSVNLGMYPSPESSAR